MEKRRSPQDESRSVRLARKTVVHRPQDLQPSLSAAIADVLTGEISVKTANRLAADAGRVLHGYEHVVERATAPARSRKRARRPKGLGSIEARGSGRWLLRWTKGWANGKQIRKAELFEGTKPEAEKKLREKLSEEIAVPTGMDFARQPLNDWLDHWLDNIASLTAAPATVVTYRAYAESYVKPALGTLRLDALSPVDVQRFVSDLAQRGLAPRTVQLAYRTVARAIRVAASLKVISRNHCCTDVVLPKRKKTNPHRALSREELQKLFKAAKGTRFEALWHLLAGTGLRPQEALGLSWGRIDFEKRTLRIDRAVTRDAGRRPVLGRRSPHRAPAPCRSRPISSACSRCTWPASASTCSSAAPATTARLISCSPAEMASCSTRTPCGCATGPSSAGPPRSRRGYTTCGTARRRDSSRLG